jgi:myo-inositol-1(or 4)-monophosphatase
MSEMTPDGGASMIEFMKKLAFDAGEICLKESEQLSADDLDFKGTRDLVTVVDRKVEDFIVEAIVGRFPDHDIIGEETGSTDRGSDHCWIIDPIDGTTSYFHRQPFYSVSIAYRKGGKTEAGVVYAPALGQMFTAVRGEGAWLNNSRLAVSGTTEMINAVLATGFACLRAGREPNNLHYLAKILPRIRDIRRCGSAAIDLAYVAAGKVDGFWEMDLNIYDIAAGVLLVEEAGGIVSDMEGGGDYPASGIVATNGKITEDLLGCLNKK